MVAPDQATCESASSVIWYAFLHAKSPGWRGGTTVAWPFTRAIHDIGEVFRFNVHHAMEVDDPLETFRFESEKVRMTAAAPRAPCRTRWRRSAARTRAPSR